MRNLLKKIMVFVVTVAAASSSCAGTRNNDSLSDTLLSAARVASSKDDLLSILDAEPKALKAAGDGAARDYDRLLLHLRPGTVKMYQDRAACKEVEQEPKCQKYRLVAYVRTLGIFVVAKLYYESAEYIVLDDVSGDEAILRSFPRFSPSGDHVLVLLMNDEQLGFAVQVWQRSLHKFSLEWSGSPYAEGGMYTTYELVRWNKENVIELEAETRSGSIESRPVKQFYLHETSHSWKVTNTPN